MEGSGEPLPAADKTNVSREREHESKGRTTSRILSAVPLWIRDNLRSTRSWKLLIRSWAATWASLVVLLPQRSLTALGNTAFFCLLGALLIPPNMPVQMFIFIISMLIIGQLLGWAFGAAAMKAATSARNQVLLRSSYQAAQQTAATAVNPDIAFKLEVFQGVFLDARSSVVYGVMLGFFSFLFALGRAYRPRLIFLVTFGQIVLDIFCTFGPLLPNVQYNIVSSLLISMGVYMAIGITCCLFIFPETMNHSYFESVAAILGELKSYGVLYGSLLQLSPEEIPDGPNGVVQKLMNQRLQLALAMQDLGKQGGLINAEFSFGRWSGSDAKSLEGPLRIVVARMVSFYSYPRLLSKTSSRSVSRSTTNTEETREKSGISNIRSAEDIAGDTELIQQLNSRRYELESENNVRMEDIMPILLDATAELRAACLSALDSAQSLIVHINRSRWKRGSQVVREKEAGLDKSLERLRASVDSYKSKGRAAIVEPFLPFLRAADEDHHLRKRLPIRPLIIAFSFTAQLVVAAEGIVALVDLIQRTARKRQRSRLWAPRGLRALGNFILKRGDDRVLNMALGENATTGLEEAEEVEAAPYRRDPDSKPPANIIQKAMNTIHLIYKWSRSPQALFAFKYVILSILLWLPAVFRSSSHFYYVEKGVWALIMAQTAISVYVSDTIYGIVSRCLGTFLGLIVGLVVWYIGNGSGSGNPYGTAAVYGVFLIPILFVRLNAPPTFLQPLIMFNATLALIVGYSWIDAKLNLVGNPGIGWPIAWRRFVLVIIGIAAAAVVMMLPPVSGRKAVRFQNAAMITELSGLYSSLMSIWIEEEKTEFKSDDVPEADLTDKESVPESNSMATPKWSNSLRKRMLALLEQLQSMQIQTSIAKFEGNLRGAWPVEEYLKLLEQESDMLAALGQITDVMSIFALVSQSLRTGEPMHQILPTTLLERLQYHRTHDILSRAEQEQLENVSYVERVSSLEFTFFSTGVTAVHQVIESLDEMHRITGRLCGEVPFRGFSKWKSDYDHAFLSA